MTPSKDELDAIKYNKYKTVWQDMFLLRPEDKFADPIEDELEDIECARIHVVSSGIRKIDPSIPLKLETDLEDEEELPF